METALVFDEKYYQTGLGRPYQRDDYWLTFFGGIAEQIIRSLNPHRVLDAGCAMGMLVESFWDRGVEAWGIDISPYAISQARPDVRSYCRHASLTERIEGQYDLATCIEVFEHLNEADARAAAVQLVRVTDRILFSSTPDDFEEATHLTVRPPIYWLKLFAELGFWPELEYDASFITQHAMLLRRRPEGLPADAVALFARNLKFRSALVQQASELEGLRRRNAESAAGVQEQIARLEQAHSARLERERSELVKEQLAQRAALETERARIESELVAVEEARKKDELLQRAELNRVRQEFESDICRISAVRDGLERELRAILASPGWKVIARYREWFMREAGTRPWLLRTYEPVARWCLQRFSRSGAQLPAPAVPRRTQLVGQPNPSSAAVAMTYEDWIRENEPSPEQLRSQAARARELSYRPLVSIVLPVYRVDQRVLQEAVDSVLAQTYENWELCIADGCPEASANRAFLSKIASADSRVRLVLLNENLGISGNSNAALATAKGEFIALLDHDDTLAPFALYELINRLAAEPDLDLIYSDHDYIDTDGRRFAPLFKPDWSPEALLSANYITHLTAIRKTLVDAVGGFDSTVDVAQDWDLFFQVVRRTRHIAHVPKVLYHWRKHGSSTALNPVVQDATVRAQSVSIQRHLDALGWPAQVEFAPGFRIHVRWREIRKGKTSVIIPSKDKAELLSRCVRAIVETCGTDEIEILIVDNGSTEPATKEYYRTIANDSRIRLLRFDAPFNYSAMNNLGAANATGDYLVFLNNDTEATSAGWLQELLAWAQIEDIGAVGAKLLYPDGTIQHAGVVLGLGGFAGHPFAGCAQNSFGLFGSTEWYRNYLAVTGACMVMRRDVFERIGGFDEQFISCGSDVEICLRLRRAGYRVVYNPFACLTHHECATRKGAVPEQDFVTSFRHYREFLEQGDPYWNPNLSYWDNRISLRRAEEALPLGFVQDTLKTLQSGASAADGPRPTGTTEEALFARWFDFSEEDLHRSRSAGAQVRGYHHVKRLVWFIPEFHNPFYGGICTILRFADFLRRQKGVSSHYVVWGSADPTQILRRIRAIDAGCSDSELSVTGVHDLLAIPESDACIATLWATAYAALRYNATKRKFYFIQDYEPLFYRAGSASALAESTYRFGFYGIANTVSLKQSYETDSGQKTIQFSPCVDTEVFFPPSSRLQQLKHTRGYRQLFCYARPNHPRNAFELVAAALGMVKKRMGDRVRIVCAGDEWQPKDHGLADMVENLGILQYSRTAELYRESDAGVALMFTRHPSYIPFELMACGALVIANRNRWTEWLLKDGENCMLSEASATCLADTIIRGLENDDERARIIANAETLIRDHYSQWDAEISRVYDFICDPGRCYD